MQFRVVVDIEIVPNSTEPLITFRIVFFEYLMPKVFVYLSVIVHPHNSLYSPLPKEQFE